MHVYSRCLFLATLTHVSVTFSRVSPVETEAPVNLTYELSDVGGDETGHNALLTWKYPEPGDLQYGWITLVYELQYRRDTEAENWKVRFGDQGQSLPVLSPTLGFIVHLFRSAGETLSVGDSRGAAQPPCGRLRGPSPLPVKELPAVEQVELHRADEHPQQAVCRCLVTVATATVT